VPFLTVVTFALFGLYRRRWRHATLEDLLRPTAAVGAIAFAAALFDSVATGGRAPWSFFVVFALVLLVLANGSRSSYRVLAWLKARAAEVGVRVLIYGAGHRGSLALREMHTIPKSPFFPVGFVDDDPAKQGRFLNGLPVLGTLEELDELIGKLGIGGVVVTTERVPRESVLRVEEICARRKAAFLRFNVSFDGTFVARRDEDTPPADPEDEVKEEASEEASR